MDGPGESYLKKSDTPRLSASRGVHAHHAMRKFYTGIEILHGDRKSFSARNPRKLFDLGVKFPHRVVCIVWPRRLGRVDSGHRMEIDILRLKVLVWEIKGSRRVHAGYVG